MSDFPLDAWLPPAELPAWVFLRLPPAALVSWVKRNYDAADGTVNLNGLHGISELPDEKQEEIHDSIERVRDRLAFLAKASFKFFGDEREVMRLEDIVVRAKADHSPPVEISTEERYHFMEKFHSASEHSRIYTGIPGTRRSPAISVKELLALPFIEVGRYIGNQMRSDDYLHFQFYDYSASSNEKRKQFELKFQSALALLFEPSHPISAVELTAALQKLQEDQKSSSWSPRYPRRFRQESASPEESPEQVQIKKYHELVEDGGRPWFSLDRLHTIAHDFEKNSALLRPWAWDPDKPGPDDWKVFARQVHSWRNFRKWQRDNRRGFDEDEELAIFYQEMKNDGFNDQDQLTLLWDFSYRKERQSEMNERREAAADQGFLGYVEAARQRLAKHGFTQPFQFQEDAELQDTWTTWMEYIEFNCFLLDKDIPRVKSSQPGYDEKCKALEEAGVLRENETVKSILTDDAESALFHEFIKAFEMEHDVRFGIRRPASEDIGPLPSSLQEAEALLETAKKRRDVIHEFRASSRPYRLEEAKMRHHQVLVRSLMELAPQIWDEQEKQRRTAAESGQAAAASGKRSRQEEEESPRGRGVAKRKIKNRRQSPAQKGEEAMRHRLQATNEITSMVRSTRRPPIHKPCRHT
ncbi:hypothetical protein BDY21DRAFT_186456 [Lineolata rhizophorae]|uniref:Uncharacterized protein n=1 Tax=Lineolata rhizophorae TaxID=578093 RepID=A0A6A6P8I3_9PEZI|nr:hypothetical protein BDY21DRAFT_186456 [Lineolata rhizophorae]